MSFKRLCSYRDALVGAITSTGGLERDGPTEYNHETTFVNIKPNINVTDKTCAPTENLKTVQRGLMADGVDITVVKNGGEAVTQGAKKRCDDCPLNDKPSPIFKRGHALLTFKVHEREKIIVDGPMIHRYLKTCSTTKAEKLGKIWTEQDFDLTNYEAKMVFAKTEVLVKEHGAAPRVIYQGTDLYNLLFGVVMMELSKRMKEELSETNPLNTGNRVIMACGRSDAEISSIIDNSPGKAIENDMSRNDSTQTVWMRRSEALLYAKLGAPMWWVREFAKTTGVDMWTRFGISAYINGQRWSGEVTTTPGNSYVNVCHTLAYLESIDITESTTLVYGDDGLTYTKQVIKDDACERISKSISESGMIGKPVVHDDRTHATFLRKRYVLGSNGHKSVPQLGRVLAKLNVRGNFNDKVKDSEYMAGKYLSAAYEHRHLPVIRERLLKTSEALSDKPYLDRRNQSVQAFGLTASTLADSVNLTQPLSIDECETFCEKVYRSDYGSIICEYEAFCNSAIDWARTNLVSGKRGEKQREKVYNPPLRNSGTLSALCLVDT
jgi:hypothetical protein